MANPIDSQLKSLYRLTLENISLRRVAVLLLSDSLKYMCQTTVEKERGEKTVVSRDEVFKSMVAELRLPESMRGPLVNIMNLIFLETCKWKAFHMEFLELYHSGFYYPLYIKRIHWTNMGTINYRKTAEAMIRDEKLNIDQRFRLACLYCLEKDIQDLWQKLSPLSKKGFYNNGRPARCALTREIIVFWTCILKGKIKKLIKFIMQNDIYSSIYQYAFETFALKGYETATEYFFEKLTCEEKEASLVGTAKALASRGGSFFETYHDVFCYLLSQMNVEQLQNVLENSSYGILKIFLDWPRQDAFFEVAKLASPYLKEQDYQLLHLLLSRTFECRYNSPKLFRDLFLITPKGFEHYRPWQYYLDPAETLELVLSGITLHSCYELVKEGEWDFFEFFIRESRLSNEDRERFAATFNSNFASLLKMETRERITKVMNNISAGSSKRDFSNCNKVNQMDSMDFHPSGQPDEELIETLAKKKEKNLGRK
ncbi:hypothetical protein HNY73_019949 [Argiope bruennichi]|uniref:Uncharacterized protein n=1 Tax=Argiope bruennichi TaxID=94029 RepID=A0A8T0E624_ARGBR|nr:hypothetical protein HNY73_019949 [Argiope bruennichi]